MPEIPQKIGKYRVLGVLGKGAMGLVYRAEDPLLGRQVAIKVITGDEVTEEMKERFHVEARAAAQLSHPNIVVVYDLGEEEGTPYIAMELLKGDDLRAYQRRHPDMTVEQACEIVAQVCEGLAFAHERRIIHRDIKPANIHVGPDGHVKIVDFGVAKMESTALTKTGMVIGTPDYMSPEQIQGKGVDARSDIFAVGVVLYEILANDKPFAAESITSVIYNIVFKQPRPFSELEREVPAEVERIVHKAMAKDLADRYQRMSDMALDLRRFLARRSGVADALPPAASQDATRVLTAQEVAAPGPAGATMQVAESAAQREGAKHEAEEGTVALGSRTGGEIAAPAPKRSRALPAVAAIVLAVAVVAAILLGLSRRGADPPAAPAARVGVEIVVVPWARLERLVGADGEEIAMADRVTPLRVELAEGTYTAQASNPEIGADETFEITVRSPGPVRVTHVLAGFDPSAAWQALTP